MNIKKRVISLLLAVVTAMLCGTFASAAKVTEIYLDNYEVGTITNGKEFTTVKNDYGEYWYKLSLKSDAAVAFTIDGLSLAGSIPVYVYKAIDKTTAGEVVWKFDYCRNGSQTMKLPKGSYFIKFNRHNTTLKFTWTEKEPTVTSLKVYIPIKKGSTMNLSTVIEGAEVPITYKSSNTSIATVSSKGIVTGKETGKVSITVKAGTKTVKLYFKVS